MEVSIVVAKFNYTIARAWRAIIDEKGE